VTGDGVSVGFPGASRAWMLSLAMVAAIHSGILAALIIRPPLPPLPLIEAPAAVLIDLAPAPAPMAALAAPPKPVEPDRIEPPPPAVQSEVMLPKPKPVPRPRPVQRTEPPKPTEETKPAPAQVAESPPAPVSPAPSGGAAVSQAKPAASSNPSAVAAWQQSLTAHLERHKRYPTSAVSKRQEGTAHIRFTMNRAGRVLAAVLERGSGVERLDRESLDLLERAQPLPTPPADVVGDRIELVVPIQFSLKR